MNNKDYIDKIELILNTSGKYITRKEKDMIIDYVNYFKTKNNVIEDKNIELVIEIERLNNIINDLLDRQNEALRYIGNHLSLDSRYKHGNGDEELMLVRKILNKHIQELKGEDKE